MEHQPSSNPGRAINTQAPLVDTATPAPAPASHTTSPIPESLYREAMAKLQPVVVSGDILGYSYVREFWRGWKLKSIVLSCANIKLTSSSKLCDYRVVEHVDREEVLIPTLLSLGKELAARGKKGFVVGSGDWYARILSQHKDELAPYFVVPYIPFDLLNDITQKSRFYAICEELGIPYPHTWRISCADPAPHIPFDELHFPVIAKPANSAEYHYAEFEGKKKIFEVQTPQELQTIVTRLAASTYTNELLVQDFIPGDDDGLCSVTLFADEHSVCTLSCMARVALQDHDPAAIGNPVCMVQHRVEDVISNAKQFLQRVGYVGYANFDVKYDPRDGSYRFFEINTRPGRNTYYVSLAGHNFVEPQLYEFYLKPYVRTHTTDEHILARLEQSLPERKLTQPFLYTCVPWYVVARSLRDSELLKRVRSGFTSHHEHSPLFNRSDSLAHNFWAACTYWHSIVKYKRYLWDVRDRAQKSA